MAKEAKGGKMAKKNLYPKRVTVRVTQEHIEKGSWDDGWKCPVALAIAQRMVVNRPFVGPSGVIVNMAAQYVLPKKAAAFIEKFDSCKPVKPFQFVMTRMD